MANNTYRVTARGTRGFDVEIVGPGGRQKTVPGFRSEHEASAWIIQAERMIRDAGPWTPVVPRKPSIRTPGASDGVTDMRIEPEARGATAVPRAQNGPSRQ